MAANNSISLVSLDFDTLKANLKQYLSSQSQFQDYNFDGSNINVLLDILSYNSFLNAYYLNLVSNESFLDSAQLRNSVVSHAKSLNYTPRSYKSSAATVNITAPQNAQPSLAIPAGTKFVGTNANGTYNFVTNNSVMIYPSGGSFSANLALFQGVVTSDVFSVDYSLDSQRFVMSNQSIDTDSLMVTVIENGGGANQVNTVFSKASTILGLSSNSAVFFLQATADTKYELVFGDGVLGRRPLNGAVIQASYRTTAGSDADGVSSFSVSDYIASSVALNVVSGSSGGANAESIESIRYNAPRYYQTQERAVTAADFKSLVLSNYTDIKACHVFGGEQVSSSVSFGTVFVSPVTYSGAVVSLSEKADIASFLQDRCTIGITPKVIDPDFLYLQVNTTVKYDPNATTLAAADIQTLVASAIAGYNSSYLTNFDTEFKLSRFEAAINAADSSISSNETTVTMKKLVNPDLNVGSYITVEYRNAFQPATLVSSTFFSGGRLYKFTDYNPNINTFSITQGPNGSVVTNSSNVLWLQDVTNAGYTSYSPAGTIDYSKGRVDSNLIMVNDFDGSAGVVFYAVPANQDIKSYSNDVIEVDIAEGVAISVVSI